MNIFIFKEAITKFTQNALADLRRQNFFAAPRKGENFELKADLNSEYKERRKDTVKRVIANMTIGKDVSSLFADVVKNMQTDDIELKKLVYLYLINYAKSQPELVILAVNTFVKDTDDPNPLIRALAIRTMGCLRVDEITNYLCEPLRKCLRDDNPYVRKTAAICVAKLYDLNPQLTVDNGFVSTLQDMISDSNPVVVANAVAALTEINDSSSEKGLFNINSNILAKLLAALNESTEWGQICILTTLADYVPKDEKEAENIVERVIPRLQHANASVVLSAVKVFMVYMNKNYITSEKTIQHICKKMTPPLVTLISDHSEIQYVALRNINLILQKRNDILNQEIRVFFCKYNDPPYVKLEKLEVMIQLCNEKNVDQVLSEFKEYCNEVDVEFVRKSVRAIGRCAIKLEEAAERCVNVLLELISTHDNYVLQEAIVVMKDIFRKYPHSYEGVIANLCKNLENLDEPEAKASLIWIIGEYAEKIENANELLEFFLESFKEESSMVQLQLITAIVKLFLKKPSQAQDSVQKVLQTATQSCDNPDIRDRAYIYWRLLSTNPQAAKTVVLSEKPPIESKSKIVSDSLLDELIDNIGTLASVYYKPASLFGGRTGDTRIFSSSAEETDANADIEGVPGTTIGGVENLLDLDFDDSAPTPQTATPPSSAAPKSSSNDLLDLLDDIPPMGNAGLSQPVTPSTPSNNIQNDLMNILGSSNNMGTSNNIMSPGAGLSNFTNLNLQPQKTVMLPASDGKGMEISAVFVKRQNKFFMELTFSNKTAQPLSEIAIQFNKNTYGLVPLAPIGINVIPPNSSKDFTLPLGTNGPVQKMNPPTLLQIAVKNNIGVYYFQHVLPSSLFESTTSTPSAIPSFGGLNMNNNNNNNNNGLGGLLI
ncbi:Adaptor protein complex beta subunit [Neocallimastix lanati (nom. inval.)]|uniref:AP complex subunit beta n=1 Tax=Neocallimastix californiae TaxID=1754190 RepID=A0A1Y2ENN2_9FUNG|nr:Adaptor protein complex beta subunit [Neocallimastix sp. JGI-2020a]ORY73132.1 Adaptor protein complex beta subunit [Neocallimastix californiae]|eukprot:ORY73132.1 Adaptor protein complex beta subunit [Neocallimastix californiae]